MHDDVARAAYYVSIHLTYASIVAGCVWALTRIGGASAAVRYWLWVLTAANFVVPTGAMANMLLRSHLTWAAPLGLIGDVAWRMTDGRAASIAGTVWALGTAAMTARLVARLLVERRGTVVGPAVRGLLRPRIVLPVDIGDVLTREELDAVVLHELLHVKRRDNLIRLLYEITLCGLWFHPLLWLAGHRMALDRELSCDESVTSTTNGRVLISALAKLAAPEEAGFLEATVSGHLSERLKLLESPRASSRTATAVVVTMFGAVVLAGMFETVAHTGCCFLAHH